MSLATIQNLFKYYDVPMSYSFVNIPPQLSKKSNGKHRWKIDEIKDFVAGAKSYRDKAIIMTMFQSGMAVGEICTLNYGDVNRGLASGELPLLIDMVRAKNLNPFKTFLGADAVKYLKIYLATRINLTRDSPLFAKEGTEKRITEGAIQMRLRELANKVFGIDEGRMNPYRPHSLRAAFRSRLTGKTDGDLIKFWMGDVLGGKAGAYLILPDDELRDLYIAVESRLSIETTSKDVNVGLDGKTSKIDAEYKATVDGLKNLVGELAERMGRFEGLAERIEELESYLKPDGPVVKGEVEALRKATE